MRISSKKLSWELGPALQKGLKEVTDNIFSSRKEFNRESATLLLKNEDFKNEINKIKSLLKIPRLNPDEDLRQVQYGDEEIEISDLVFSLDETTWQTYDKEIKSLLKKYGLPFNFYDWIQTYILYGKPHYQPLYNIELPNQIMKHPETLQAAPLTTQEKKYVKCAVRARLGIKRKPRKKIEPAYHEFLSAINRNKNKMRRLRTINTALKTLKIGKRVTVDVEDEIKGGYNKGEEKYTYNKLVVDLHPDEEGESDTRLANRYRKQKERLRKRLNPSLK